MAKKKETEKKRTSKAEPTKETEKKAATTNTADKKITAEKPAEKKTNIKNTADKKPAEKKKKDRLPYSEIVTRANRQNWKKTDLHNMIQQAYPNEEVIIEELNKSQVAFTVNGDRLPEEGYFSVSSSFG